MVQLTVALLFSGPLPAALWRTNQSLIIPPSTFQPHPFTQLLWVTDHNSAGLLLLKVLTLDIQL